MRLPLVLPAFAGTLLQSCQDTLLLQGDGFVDLDFMWGNGGVFFQNDQLPAITSGGYYTLIRNGLEQSGNVYVNCRLTPRMELLAVI